MYSINIGDKILYYPGNSDYTAYDLELNEEVGKVGELTAKIPVQNPLYASVVEGSILTILKDGIEYWRGETKGLNNDIDNIADIYCLEDLTWLADEYLPPASITNETYAQRFQSVIETYNSTRPSDRQFAVGMITNVNSSDTCNWVTEYEWSILDSIRQNICKDTGYIRVRRVTTNGVVTRYIDVVRLEDYGTQATQPIEYGYNLLDYLKESDCQNLVNVLFPYGDELETEVYAGYSQRLQGATITNNDSVALYGRHAKAVIFNGVTDLPTLNALAAAYLTRYSQPQITMEVKAVDLGDIENVGMFNVGDSVRIIATPFGIDQWLYHTQIKRDLQNVEKNVITLSGRVQQSTTLTSQTVDTVDMIKNLPSKSSILAEAKANALRILNGENGGVIYFVSNEENQITEQIIANNLDLDQATKAWRWNINGFAYLQRTYPSDDWTVRVAMTMDGGIVADFITTGTMYADRIRGGTLTLGGAGNQNGVLRILNASGNEIGRWDANGINATTGTFSGALNGATGTFAGSLSAASGTFSGSLSAAGGTFSGQLVAATGTMADGTGILYLNGGNLYMDNNGGGGAGLYATQGGVGGNGYYSCWGAINSAARVPNVQYLEVPTIDVIRAGNNASDERLKEQIEDIDSDFAEKLILGIHPKQFKYKETEFNNGSDELNFGVIAQEILEIEEECGIEEKNRLCYKREMDDMYAVEYKQLIAPMIKVIQNQQEQIDKLQVQVNELVKIIKEERNG